MLRALATPDPTVVRTAQLSSVAAQARGDYALINAKLTFSVGNVQTSPAWRAGDAICHGLVLPRFPTRAKIYHKILAIRGRKCKEETTKCSFEPCKFADLVKLGQKLLKVDPMAIKDFKDFKAMETLREGKTVFKLAR